MIDALRASATMIAALEMGMAAVRPVASAEECTGEVTAGERGGRKLPNFRHGNSPTEIMRAGYHGKTLVLTSTNGIECLLSAAGPATHAAHRHHPQPARGRRGGRPAGAQARRAGHPPHGRAQQPLCD